MGRREEEEEAAGAERRGVGVTASSKLKTTRNDGKASGGREARKYASPCFLGTKGGRLDGSEKLG
jgi:hypothetical protein